MIASGADSNRVQTVMGHGSATVTLDTYGHLMPGRLDDIPAHLDDFARPARPAATASVLKPAERWTRNSSRVRTLCQPLGFFISQHCHIARSRTSYSPEDLPTVGGSAHHRAYTLQR